MFKLRGGRRPLVLRVRKGLNRSLDTGNMFLVRLRTLKFSLAHENAKNAVRKIVFRTAAVVTSETKKASSVRIRHATRVALGKLEHSLLQRSEYLRRLPGSVLLGTTETCASSARRRNDTQTNCANDLDKASGCSRQLTSFCEMPLTGASVVSTFAM